MATIQQRFEVEQSISDVYDALARPQHVLESLPGVVAVQPTGEDVYRVSGVSAASVREVELQLTAKTPPRRIEWRTSDGVWSGAIELEPVGAERTAVSVVAESASTADAVSPPPSVLHDGVHALKHALQPAHVRMSRGGYVYGSGGSTRRYASEWRDAAQTALSRPTEFPFKVMRTLSRQMDRMWGDVWRGTPISKLPHIVPGLPWNPDVEVCEQDDLVRVCIDVPGVEESHLQVEIDESALTVRGERQDERASERGHRRSELHYGSFTRRIPLPDGVDPDAARAVLRNGVLEIRIPMHRREPRRVPVQHAS